MSAAQVHAAMWAHPLPGMGHNFTTLVSLVQQRRASFAALGLRAVVLLQEGWLLTWVQGDKAACEQALSESQSAARPFEVQLLLSAPGTELLPDAWSLVWRHYESGAPDLRQGVAQVRLQSKAGRKLTPVQVWRSISTQSVAPGGQVHRARAVGRVLLLSRDVTLAMKFVAWVAHEVRAELAMSRVAGSGTQFRDVAASYTDIMSDQGRLICLQALARSGLRIGLVRLFLGDCSRVVLLLPTSSQPSDVATLVSELAVACELTQARPRVLAVCADGALHAAASEACQLHGFQMRSALADAQDPAQTWAAIAHLVEPSPTTVPSVR